MPARNLFPQGPNGHEAGRSLILAYQCLCIAEQHLEKATTEGEWGGDATEALTQQISQIFGARQSLETLTHRAAQTKAGEVL
jgi:hypothetical protein